VEELKQEIENKMKKYETAVKVDGVARCWQMFEEDKIERKYQKVNIAIAGRSGSGKSNFINALVRKWTGRRPALVGVPATTMHCTGYEHPINPNIILWDLPGFGTFNFPSESYLEKVNADLYDVFIIMTANRLTEQDTWLGKEVQRRIKPVIFVRTKIGNDVEIAKYDHPDKDEKVVLGAINADMMDKCAEFLYSLGVFLIDNHQSDKYEFNSLEKCIVEKLSTSKGQAMVFPLANLFRRKK